MTTDERFQLRYSAWTTVARTRFVADGDELVERHYDRLTALLPCIRCSQRWCHASIVAGLMSGITDSVYLHLS